MPFTDYETQEAEARKARAHYKREVNAILADIPWREPEPADAEFAMRTALPSVSWRKLDVTPAFVTPSDRLRAWLAEALVTLSYWVRP